MAALRSNERVVVGATLEDAIARAAECVVQALSGAGNMRSVALAGGRTPASLYAALTKAPYREQVDWRRVEWFWGDERAVPPDHSDSNYRMARETLLVPLGIEEGHIHRMHADDHDLDGAARDYEQTIRTHVPAGESGVPRLDLVLLGIGTDGHTASLFPGSAGLQETQRLVIANHVPSLNTWRMTMTYPLLLVARQVLFFITGADKAETMARILTSDPDNSDAPPAARVRRAGGQVIWVLDASAAQLVPGTPTV